MVSFYVTTTPFRFYQISSYRNLELQEKSVALEERCEVLYSSIVSILTLRAMLVRNVFQTKITVYKSVIKCSMPYRQNCTRYLVYRTGRFQVATLSFMLNAITRQL